MTKFKYIERFMDCKPQAFTLPVSRFLSEANYQEIKSELSFDSVSPYILRSELKGEGAKQLRSGESLSIKDICTKEELDRAWRDVVRQTELNRALVQNQIDTDAHITGICYQNHIFLEIKIKEDIYFSFLSNGFRVGHEVDWDALEAAISEFQDKEYMIFELGLSQGEKVVLYQLMDIDENLCSKILDNGYFKGIFKNIREFEKPLNFYQMLKALFMSKVSRLKAFQKRSFHPMKNWNYIMFYFSLYRYLENKDFEIRTFEDFFNWTRLSESWIATSALEHIKLANKFSTSSQLKAELDTGSNIFIGEGKRSGNIVFQRSLDPLFIKSLTEQSLIFTQDKSILGHGYLSAVEYGHFIVGGLSSDEYIGYSTAEKLTVDFNQKKIMLI